MPPALRAGPPSNSTTLEGLHVKHLLAIGHTLHDGCRALSTSCLARAFKLASKTGSKVARGEVRKSCRFCFASNADAECKRVVFSARQVARRKARASSRILSQALPLAQSQAMLSRYSSSAMLLQHCQVCGRDSTWAQHTDKHVQGDSQQKTTPLEKPTKQSVPSTCTAADRTPHELTNVIKVSTAIDEATPVPATDAALPQVTAEVPKITSDQTAVPGDYSARSSVYLVTAQPQGSHHRLQSLDQGVLSASGGHPRQPESGPAERLTTTAHQPAPDAPVRATAGHSNVTCQAAEMQGGGSDAGTTQRTVLAPKKKRKKQKQHVGIGVRADGGTTRVGACQAAAVSLGDKHELAAAAALTPKQTAKMQLKPSAYMDKLRAQLQGSRNSARISASAGVKKASKKKKS
eukprot:jgi/Ulvmu1/2652/UM014_0106.1